jgi:spore coat polysaccharide biosynthesis protein SpsF
MRSTAIIQARMSSTRLPGKVMLDVAGKPLLQRVIGRAQRAQKLDQVIIATSEHEADEVIARFCRDIEVPCFRGSEDDVLDRYYRAAKHFKAESVVRLTADCPLLDPAVIDMVVDRFHEGGYDYLSNSLECTYPDGLDTEVFTMSTLDRAWREARLKSEREHVTAYIYKHPEIFRVGSVKNESADYSAMRWTVDEPQDLEFVRAIYTHFDGCPPGLNGIVEWLEQHPELADINAGIGRNEGYQKSLQNDGVIPDSESK